MKKMMVLIAVLMTAQFSHAGEGDYVKACGRLQINEWSQKVSLSTQSGEIQLENLSTIAYSNGQGICVGGYEGRSFSGKKTIQVMTADSQ